jgi:hypothetical protein
MQLFSQPGIHGEDPFAIVADFAKQQKQRKSKSLVDNK